MRKIIPWEQVDWRKSNQKIAKERDCSVPAVRMKRKALGLPPLKTTRPSPTRTLISHMKTANKTIKEIAKEAGCSDVSARSIVLRLKKPYKRGKSGCRAKYDWSKADWSKSPYQIAKKLGIKNVSSVYQYRKTHGTPPVHSLSNRRSRRNRRTGYHLK